MTIAPITDAEAVQYAEAIRSAVDAHAGGDELADDVLSMAADLSEWVEAHAAT